LKNQQLPDLGRDDNILKLQNTIAWSILQHILAKKKLGLIEFDPEKRVGIFIFIPPTFIKIELLAKTYTFLLLVYQVIKVRSI
jgi:hypothetical protein